MDSDDDFLPPSQFGRTQPGSSMFRSQSVSSSSTNRSQGINRPAQHIQANPGPSQSHSVNSSTNQHAAAGSRSQQTPGTSQARPKQFSPEQKLSQIQEGMAFLMGQMQELTEERSGFKLPASKAEQKPYDKKPNIREQCQICKKTYANKTTLFRHYRAIHEEMNPEKYHGFSLSNTVVSLDASLRDIQCSTSGYVPPSQNSIDSNRATPSTVVQSVNANNSRNDENVNNNCEIVKDKMHKCEDCGCYFEERRKFDEHMKVQHGFEVVCKICNKNLLFKDIDAHVKDSHPDVYCKKNIKEKKEKTVIEKVMKKQGQRIHVFVCTECDNIMYNKFEAERHSRCHRKGLKIKTAPRSRASRSVGNFTNLIVSNDNDKVLFTCDYCNTSTGSYDAAVEHSQNHITNMSYSVECVTQTCSICDLKFEPLCYKKHMDLHYNNKELHKESFTCYKYKYQLLLTDMWFDCYDMTDPILKNILSQSVYFHTRSVKMRIMGDEGICKVYKCCQCDKFVEPAAVANHTMNYDTCLKVKSSYACDICNRKYNNRLARDRHTTDHNSTDSFKVVIFNNERDKELNRILNDPNKSFGNYINTMRNVNEPHSSQDNNNVKVIYKCLCGLCFVHKQTAESHKEICPGKYPRKPCPKCNNIFDSDELVDHCLEHHLNNVKITIENIAPDAIVVDSDEEREDTYKDGAVHNGHIEVIEIHSSDEEKSQNKSFNKINIEHCSSEDGVNKYDFNTHENVIAETDVLRPERNDSQLDIHSHQDTRHEVEDNVEELPEMLEDDEMTDDDSQDTTNYEHIETPAASPMSSIVNTCNEIKCVPTNLLLEPYLFETGFPKKSDISMLKKEISTDIEIVRHDIETITTKSLIREPFDIIKQEKSWWYNPTDYSNVHRRPSLRQIEMTPSSSTISQKIICESLLTDDEDGEMIPNNENESNHGESTANISSNAATVSKETETTKTSAELLDESSTTLRHSDKRHIQYLNTQEAVDKNMIISHENLVQSELIENNIDQEQTYPSTNKDSNGVNSFLDTDVDNIGDNDNDNLFLPTSNQDYNNSCNFALNQIEKVISLDTNPQQTEYQVMDSSDKEIALATRDTNITEPESSHLDIMCTDDIGGIGVVIENAATLYPNNTNIQKESNKEFFCEDTTECNITQSNHEEDTLNFGGTHEEGTSTNNILLREDDNIFPEITLSPIVDTTNIKNEFDDYMNVKIKTELIAQNEHNINDKFDKGDDVIKIEPKNTLDNNEYERNKENYLGFTYNTKNANDKNCIIC